MEEIEEILHQLIPVGKWFISHYNPMKFTVFHRNPKAFHQYQILVDDFQWVIYKTFSGI